MGSDFCTCLNDLTGGESEDLSQSTNKNDNVKRVNKKPKVELRKQTSLDSADPLQSQRENMAGVYYVVVVLIISVI